MAYHVNSVITDDVVQHMPNGRGQPPLNMNHPGVAQFYESAPPPMQSQPQTFPNPNVTPNSNVYMAVYSSVPVYEMMCRGIGVMRRRNDSYMNATQILKVAGVDKGRRTKILERDIITTGVYEKVQGGYGRYQGTWIPFQRARELAEQFGIGVLLAPLFDFVPPPTAPQDVANAFPVQPQASTSAAPAPVSSSFYSSPFAQTQGRSTLTDRKREREPLPPLPESEVKRSRSEANGMPLPIAVPAQMQHPPEPQPLTANRPQPGPSSGLEAPLPVPAKLPPPPGFSNGHEPSGLDLRKPTKPLKPTSSIGDDPLRVERHRGLLMSIFTDHSNVQLSQHFPPDLEVDTPIDEHLHTALHWSAALARLQVVSGLLGLGADVNRGNNLGETPLIRSVMVTNNHDQDSFPTLLECLSTSLRTVDDLNRTVLHHIALIAGIKGRAASARYYMECVLEHIARRQQGHFKALVDVQDFNGDTALNIAARVGNRGLVRMLLEVGADKSIANKLGLRPVDFGIEVEELTVSAGEEVVSQLKGPPISIPYQRSQDVGQQLSDIISQLQTDFAKEVEGKSEALEKTRLQLRAATKELAEQRRQISHWRSMCSQVDESQQRIKNIERAIAQEDAFDWTGRSEIDGRPATDAGAAFVFRGPTPNVNMTGILQSLQGVPVEHEAPLPTEDSVATLVQLRRMKAWYERTTTLLNARVELTRGAGADLEARCRKVVSICCGVPLDKVDSLLEHLVTAMESDGSKMDMARVANFMGKIKSDRSA